MQNFFLDFFFFLEAPDLYFTAYQTNSNTNPLFDLKHILFPPKKTSSYHT